MMVRKLRGQQFWTMKFLNFRFPEVDRLLREQNQLLTFTVNATFSPNQSLRVYNGILQSSQGDGNFIGNSFDGYFDLDFSNGATTSRVSIPVINDDVEETSGVVGVVLADDEADPITYTVVAGDYSSAEISVYDDDSLPNLSLLGPVGNVAGI